MKRKLLSCILASAMMFMQMSAVIADTADSQSTNEVTALSKEGVVFRMGLIGDVHISDKLIDCYKI